MLVCSLEYHVLVLMPLIVTAAIFRPLLPTAAVAMLLPVVVSAVAASQAEIPRDKLKSWSRPLVALLFFLQPLVRGWSRYQGSFRAPASRMARRENLRSALREGDHQDFGLLEYWNDRGLDRTEFLAGIIERLDRQGWQNKVDAGWNDYDVQVYGSAWSLVQMITVAETLGHGKQILRARLKAGGTPFAKAVFWTILGAQMLVIGFLGRQAWWPYLLLLSMPLFAWFLAKDQRDLQRLLGVFMDELAGELKLKRIEPEPARTAK
jgi:hypothetical protein